jgi:hypothetical protein
MMATQSDISIVLPLNHIDELFIAPEVNPFSTYEVDIFGESAMECTKNRVAYFWPRRPNAVHVTFQLPADQITPGLTERTVTAIQRYCADRIESNQIQREIVIKTSKRQFAGAMIGFVIALIIIVLLAINPFGLIPEFLRGILMIFAFFAGAVLTFDSLWSVVFDWVPFVQDTAAYQVLQKMEVVVEALPHK